MLRRDLDCSENQLSQVSHDYSGRIVPNDLRESECGGGSRKSHVWLCPSGTNHGAWIHMLVDFPVHWLAIVQSTQTLLSYKLIPHIAFDWDYLKA
jgi:hypothetical protein